MNLLKNYEFLKIYARFLSPYDKSKASEIVQDTLIKVWQTNNPKNNNELPTNAEMAFCRSILHNIFMDSIRGRNRDRLIFELSGLREWEENEAFKKRDAEAVDKNTHIKINAIFQYIPIKLRNQETFSAWLMNKWLKYPYKKIAKIIKTNIEDVNGKIHRVNKLIKNRFYDPTRHGNFFDPEPGEIKEKRSRALNKRLTAAAASKRFYDRKRLQAKT